MMFHAGVDQRDDRSPSGVAVLGRTRAPSGRGCEHGHRYPASVPVTLFFAQCHENVVAEQRVHRDRRARRLIVRRTIRDSDSSRPLPNSASDSDHRSTATLRWEAPCIWLAGTAPVGASTSFTTIRSGDMADFVSGVGPLFGPDFVVVTVNDATGCQYGVHVYPDAHNPELRAAGLPTQYYFQPAQVYLAHKQTSPQDFDFEMTLFKGLGSEEANITPTELQGASTEMGGGF